MAAHPKKIVLAYSGGLDTSVILTWLKETYDAEVVAFCADVGQGEELGGLDEKARATGASKCIIADLKEEFARDFCFPMLRANAIYEGEYLLGTSIARPVIAKAMMEVAQQEGADAIAHGATGKGNDQVRFELAAMAIDPRIQVIAPWRTWSLRSRTDCIEYCKDRKIPIEVTAEKPYSMDANLFHISYEGGVLEDTWNEPLKDMFRWTTDPEDAPDTPEYIVVGYEKGDPISVDGERLSPATLIQRLNEIGSRHGVGRVDIVENRFVGMKSRGVYETPGGTILQRAHRAVESITVDREVLRIRDGLIPTSPARRVSSSTRATPTSSAGEARTPSTTPNTRRSRRTKSTISRTRPGLSGSTRFACEFGPLGTSAMMINPGCCSRLQSSVI